MLKLLADENLANLELFQLFADLLVKPGRDICADDLVDIDGLLVRSVTRVDKQLLQKANRLKFVGSATIGTDHLDIDLLESNKIHWANAPGCNADAVVDYVTGVLAWLEPESLLKSDKSLGIAGYGNVGQKLKQRFSRLGFETKVYDPLRHESFLLNNKRELFDCDIISLHMPLTVQNQSDFPTRHFIGPIELELMAPGQLLINTSRGAVVSEEAILNRNEYKLPRLALDVYENEPVIPREIFDLADITTPHIAGYSRQGKINGTLAIYQSFCRLFDIPQTEFNDSNNKTLQVSLQNDDDLIELIRSLVPLGKDSFELGSVITQGKGTFDGLRKDYCLREEFSSIELHGDIKKGLSAKLAALGFRLNDQA